MISSFFLLFLVLFVSLSLSENEFDGEFKMTAGSDCKYHVMHFDDEGIIGFRIKCSCRGTGKRLTYSCAYFGKPNVCPGFNDTIAAQTGFYSELADYIKGRVTF